MSRFHFYHQHDAMDCGPTCLRMIAKYHSKDIGINILRNHSQYNKDGVSILGISQAAENVGFKTIAVSLSLEDLITEAPPPLHTSLESKPLCCSLQSNIKQIYHCRPSEGYYQINQNRI